MLHDTHLHIIDLNRLDYPWLSEVPALNQSNLLQDYEAKARRLGISRCYHMECDVAPEQIEAEVDYVAELMQQPDTLLVGCFASCRPEESTFAAQLDRMLESPHVKGLRRVLHVMPDDLSTTELFRDNIKRLSNTRLTYDLCVFPRQMQQAIALVDHCPDVTFILDHCGVPDIKGGDFEAWKNNLQKIAERPNVNAKISGVIAYGDPDAWTLADLAPYIQTTAEAFGETRLVWGSDSPVCNLGANIETWVAATYAITATWSESERSALFFRNASRIWSEDRGAK